MSGRCPASRTTNNVRAMGTISIADILETNNPPRASEQATKLPGDNLWNIFQRLPIAAVKNAATAMSDVAKLALAKMAGFVA